MSMTKTKVWEFLNKHFLHESSSGRAPARCPVTAEHHGLLIAVAGRGNATVMMCTHHAMAWSESDQCRNEAWRGALPLGPAAGSLPDPRTPYEPRMQSQMGLWCH